MPIRPEMRGLYPPDWREVSLAIKQRAGWRCECEGECRSDHGGRCPSHHGDHFNCHGKERETRPVVLTTAHLNHNPADCSDSNLKAYCEACHLRYDREHHAETARETRRKRLEEAGVMELGV